MKKVISLILCAVIISVSSLGVIATANEKEDIPTILVPGFMQSYMFIEGENGAEDYYLWLPHIEAVIGRIIDDMPNFLASIFGLLLGDVETFGETLGGGAVAVAGKLACNPDGTPKYGTTCYNNDPAEANAANLKKIVNREGERKNFLFESFVDYAVANNYADLEDIFIFEYHSCYDAIVVAQQLRDYIKAVKDYTKSEKVNLFTVSYGGLIAATYLYDYMDEGDVNKAVLNVPPLQGTDFPDRLFRKNVELPLETLIDFVESVLGVGTEIASLLKNTEADFLNETMNSISPSLMEVVHYWSSLYTLSSPELYEGMKRDYLDPVENAKIIENNDKIHNEIMPNISRIFADCAERGIDVSIIAGTGNSICLGGNLNGDILVPTYSSTGATVCEMGKRFSDGYTGVKTACNNPDHNHVSPSMEVDASSAYLPEKTWFIDDSYHAMYELEDYAMSLSAKLLFTDELKDVHSDPDYPQFEYSNNPHRGIHAKFNSSPTGYISSDDTAITVENLYARSAIQITSITVSGISLDFNIGESRILMPGEKTEITFSGEIPAVSATRTDVTVNYIKVGTSTGATGVNFPMTINNGTAPAGTNGKDDISEIAEVNFFAEIIKLIKAYFKSISNSVKGIFAA